MPGAMQLTVIGSGTSVPHPHRASPAYWVGTPEGTLLLDASAAIVHRIPQEDLDWTSLDAIWISHFHLDHVGGLAPFLFGTKYAPQTQHRTKPLKIFGPAGVARLIETFDGAYNYRLLQQPFSIDIIEVAPKQEFRILKTIKASTFKTPHTPESLAIRLEHSDGSAMVYTSDTGFSEELAEFATGVDLLAIESSFWKNKPVETHLELRDAMRIAELANPRRTLLIHLYPEWDEVDAEAEARKLWPGETIVAKDGLKIVF